MNSHKINYKIYSFKYQNRERERGLYLCRRLSLGSLWGSSYLSKTGSHVSPTLFLPAMILQSSISKGRGPIFNRRGQIMTTVDLLFIAVLCGFFPHYNKQSTGSYFRLKEHDDCAALFRVFVAHCSVQFAALRPCFSRCDWWWGPY